MTSGEFSRVDVGHFLADIQTGLAGLQPVKEKHSNEVKNN